MDLYANATPPQGILVQGQTPVQTLEVTIDAGGHRGVHRDTSPQLPSQPLITATATDPSNTTSPSLEPAARRPPAFRPTSRSPLPTRPTRWRLGRTSPIRSLVTNNGPDAAQGLTLTTAVPAGTTFVSFTAPAGWTATTPAPGGDRHDLGDRGQP